MKKEVNEYIKKHNKWQNQLSQLRKILLSTDLVECIKWGIPTYTIKNKNIVSFSGYKNHCGLWFFNGNLLQDKHGILSNAQEGKTKSMRHYKLYEGDVISAKIIKSYIEEAIKNQKEGKVVKQTIKKRSTPIKGHQVDSYLKDRLDKNASLKKKFLKLTHVQQRDYSNYISDAKREATKVSRIEKIIPLIAEGNSLNCLWAKK